MATIMLSSVIIKTILNNERLSLDLLKQSIRRTIHQHRKARRIYPKGYGRISSISYCAERATTSSCLGGLQKSAEHPRAYHGIPLLQQIPISLHEPTRCTRHYSQERCHLPGGWMNALTVEPIAGLPVRLRENVQIRSLVTSSKCFDNGKSPPHSAAVGPWEAVKEKKEKFREARQDLIEDIKETKAKVREQMDAIIERENIWTVPNLLCISRIACSPLLCYFVMSAEYKLSLGLFMVAGFTDLLDGWIARKFPSQASRLGSFLDPLADKILVALLFLSLTYVGLIPLPLTVIIVYRDVMIIAGASYIRYKSLPPPRTIARYFDATHATAQLAPTTLSKINTAIQLSLITASLAAPVFAFTDHYLLKGLWWFTAATTMGSGISYIFTKDTYKILKKMKPS